MAKRKKDPSIHEHPAFRALVDDLKKQSPEQQDRFKDFLDAELAKEETTLLTLLSRFLQRFHDLPADKQQALVESLEGKSPAEVLAIIKGETDGYRDR